MTISYNWLKEYIPKLPKPEKLADLLTLHSFEVESVQRVGNDYILEIDVLPNRAHDCLSHIGIAKECAAITNLKFKIPSFVRLRRTTEGKRKTSDFIKVEVKDKDACPRYTARIITDIKVGPSPKWLKQRLKAIGQKPINNIVDATNYVMFELGQPLHAFDLDKLEGKTIIVRYAKKGEKITTLDNEICKLDEDILVIADAKSPLALAGVKGGKKAEITNKTKTVVLESANFNYKTVRATSKKTSIKTESSLRFEHELDPNLTSQAVDRVAEIIQRIEGGKIAKGIIDIYSLSQKFAVGVKIKLNLDKVERIVGIKISKQDAIKKLKLLGLETDENLKVAVPTLRQDIKIEEDLIEEIIRLMGYDKIPASAPLGLLGLSRLDEVVSLTNKIKTIFESFGFNEVYNFSFVGDDDLDKLGIDKKNYLELENPLSLDLKYLRRDLLLGLLKNIKNNLKLFPEIKIFELGTTYCPLPRQIKAWGDKSPVKEEKMLAGLIFSQKEKIRGEKFYELKGIIDGLFNKLGITDYWYDDFQATSEWTDEIFWQKGSTAEIKVGDEEIGFLGEISHSILNRFNIRGLAAGFNLNFDRIFKLAQEELIYQPSSSYPAAVRDLAVLVNQRDRVADVLNVIETVGGELVRDVDLFDMYEGQEIPNGKKNLAFHIIYQSDERTLRDEEVNKIQKKIIKELEKREWEVRK